MAKGDELVRYITKQVIEYMDVPREMRRQQRRQRREKKKEVSWLYRWFGMIPYWLKLWFGSKKASVGSTEGEESEG